MSGLAELIQQAFAALHSWGGVALLLVKVALLPWLALSVCLIAAAVVKALMERKLTMALADQIHRRAILQTIVSCVAKYETADWLADRQRDHDAKKAERKKAEEPVAR